MAANKKKTGSAESKKAPLWITNEEPFAYLAIKKGDVPVGPFATGNDVYIREVIQRWQRGEEPKEESDEVEEPELPIEDSQEATLSAGLSSAVAFASSQTHLIAVTSSAPTLFDYVHITATILNPVQEATKPVYDDDTAAVFALDQAQYENLDKARKNLLDLRLGVAALPNATLMSLVASFDALIIDLLNKMLRFNRSWMEKGDRKLPFEKLAHASSINDLITEAIKEEVYQFSRGSHDEQARYIEVNFGISIRDKWKRWPDYIEVFERRNLIAHGETRFNDRYVSVCEQAKHKGSNKLLGQKIEIRSSYLTQALDILTEFAILLPFSVWRKISDEQEEKAFGHLNEAAYTLIANGRYTVAERILEFALSLAKVKVPLVIIQRLTINRASALRHAGLIDQANEVLDNVDWSASSDLFQICMQAVRGNAAEVAKLLPKFADSPDLNPPTFKQWPCFSFVRDDEAVKQAFLNTFGEPLSVPARQTSASEPSAEALPKAQTVH